MSNRVISFTREMRDNGGRKYVKSVLSNYTNREVEELTGISTYQISRYRNASNENNFRISITDAVAMRCLKEFNLLTWYLLVQPEASKTNARENRKLDSGHTEFVDILLEEVLEELVPKRLMPVIAMIMDWEATYQTDFPCKNIDYICEYNDSLSESVRNSLGKALNDIFLAEVHA